MRNQMSPAGQYENGQTAYQNGDYETALRLFREAADKGETPAQYMIGCMYYHGEGVKQSHEEAARWFHMAAELGHLGAQFSLGRMYECGRGLPRSIASAIKWYSLAADAGDRDAQLNLGLIYLNGEEVECNYAKAMDLLKVNLLFLSDTAEGLRGDCCVLVLCMLTPAPATMGLAGMRLASGGIGLAVILFVGLPVAQHGIHDV